MRRWIMLTAALAAAALAHSNADASELAIRAGKILTLTGAPIENGVILVRDGKITAVGKDLAIPSTATVLDAKDRVVMPAWIEPHTYRMLDRPNERVPIVPFLTVLESIDPGSLTMEQLRRDGIGTVGVFQAGGTQISAMAAVIHPVGIEVTRMVLRRDAGLKISLDPPRGTNRMAQTAAIRAALDAVRPLVAERKKLAAEKKPLPDLDPKVAPLVALLEGREPAFLWCPRAMDVPLAIDLVEAYGLRATLILGAECHKAAALVAKAKLPVILDPALEHGEVVDGEPVITDVAGAFHRAGVRFALSTAYDQLGRSEPWYQAATAVRQGVPRDVALASMTATAADILGVGDRIGTIEPGKDATFVVLTGDPLDVSTWVDRLLVRGRIEYSRDQDERLVELLK